MRIIIMIMMIQDRMINTMKKTLSYVTWKNWYADKRIIPGLLFFFHHDFDGSNMISVLHPFLKDGFQLSEILHVWWVYIIVLISEQIDSKQL